MVSRRIRLNFYCNSGLFSSKQTKQFEFEKQSYQQDEARYRINTLWNNIQQIIHNSFKMDDFALFVDKQLKAQQSSKGLMLAIPVALGFLTEPKSKTENQFIGIWEDL